MLGWLTNAVEEKKLIRRCLVIWIVALITYATIQMFGVIDVPNGVHGAAYGTLTALLMPLVGLYMWQRHEEKKNDNSK